MNDDVSIDEVGPPGIFGNWSEWSLCSPSGSSRSRLCQGPGPCVGETDETKLCVKTPFPKTLMESSRSDGDGKRTNSEANRQICNQNMTKNLSWKLGGI